MTDSTGPYRTEAQTSGSAAEIVTKPKCRRCGEPIKQLGAYTATWAECAPCTIQRLRQGKPLQKLDLGGVS